MTKEDKRLLLKQPKNAEIQNLSQCNQLYIRHCPLSIFHSGQCRLRNFKILNLKPCQQVTLTHRRLVYGSGNSYPLANNVFMHRLTLINMFQI